MNSLARRHRERMAALSLAAAAGAVAVAEAGTAAPAPENAEYAELLELLGVDLHELSTIQSVERKVEAKGEMIERYKAWVEGAMLASADGKAAQDEIVVTMLVWSIDVQDWTMALQIGAHVLTHGLALPERYKRTPATVIAEEIAEASLSNVDSVDHGTLIATQVLTDEHDMPDEARAKLMKAIGRKLRAEADAFDPEAEGAIAGGKPALMSASLAALKRALELDKQAGVKKEIETLERELTKLAPPN